MYDCNNPPGTTYRWQYNMDVCNPITTKDACQAKDGCQWDNDTCEYILYPFTTDNKDECIFGSTYRFKECRINSESKAICANNTPTECRAKEDCEVQCRVRPCDNLSEQECKDASRCTFESSSSPNGVGYCRVTNYAQAHTLCEKSGAEGTCAYEDADCIETCEESDDFRRADPDDNDCKYGVWSLCESAKPRGLCDKEDCGTDRCEPSYRQYASDPGRYEYVHSFECMTGGPERNKGLDDPDPSEPDSEP